MIKVVRNISLSVLLIGTINSHAVQKEILVRSVPEFNVAAENASPGDKIILANGILENAELSVSKEGTAGVFAVIVMNFLVAVISKISYIPIFIMIAVFVPMGIASIYFLAGKIKPIDENSKEI